MRETTAPKSARRPDDRETPEQRKSRHLDRTRELIEIVKRGETPEEMIDKGQALIEIKKIRPWRYEGHKGGFNKWVRRNLPFRVARANAYIRIATHVPRALVAKRRLCFEAMLGLTGRYSEIRIVGWGPKIRIPHRSSFRSRRSWAVQSFFTHQPARRGVFGVRAGTAPDASGRSRSLTMTSIEYAAVQTNCGRQSGERSQEIEAMAAEIAHEIRSPLNIFRLLLGACEESIRTGQPPSAADVEIAREELERLERMAANMRRLAGGPMIERRALDLRTVVQHVVRLLDSRLGNRPLQVEVPPGTEVDGDRDALIQILLNLLNNAVDACPAPGPMGLRCSVTLDGGLCLTVWDSGSGFAADPGQLFRPWFTTKPDGSGLGLPITRRLVYAHGWQVHASRCENRTCFDIRISAQDWRRTEVQGDLPMPADKTIEKSTYQSPALSQDEALVLAA